MAKFFSRLSFLLLSILLFLPFAGCGSSGSSGGGGVYSYRTVSGAVRESDGATPIANAFVVLNTSGVRSTLTTTANALGVYSFSQVPTGTFRAAFWLSQDDYEANPDTPLGALNINTSTGSVTGLNLQDGVLAPWINLVNPTQWESGDNVTVTGTDFGTAIGTNRVTFDSTPVGTFVSWCATQIICTANTDSASTAQVIVNDLESNQYQIVNRKWTVMVYLDADNNLASDGVTNMQQMISVGNSDDVDILVLWDGCASYHQSALPDGTRLYRITQGAWEQLANYGELNMGNPQTLVDFVNYSTANYPAQKYMLVFWNHGGGWRAQASKAPLTKNVCWDLTNGDDSLSLPEINTALATISGNLGKKIDLVGFDACLMSMLEVGYDMKDSVGMMTASEETEPGAGWPYDQILTYLIDHPTCTAAQLGTNIVQDYLAYYGTGAGLNYAVLNLDKTGEIVTLLNDLTQKIETSGTDKATVRNIAYSAYYFSDEDFIDLKDFARRLSVSGDISSQEVKDSAAALNTALIAGIDNFVVYADYSRVRASLSDTGGVSIYFPYGSYSSSYNNINFAQDTDWASFLQYILGN